MKTKMESVNPLRIRPRGKLKQRGVMNSTERKFYEQQIMTRVAAGEIVAWWYEGYAFRLTEKTPSGKPGIRYTPDFVVMLATGELVVYEIKGVGNARRQDLNRVKLFADLFPFRVFVATQLRKKDGGGFKIEEY